MNKAVYGLLRSALLFYKHPVAALEKYGFKVNPHDPCVANADINSSQMTVTWHVNDLKVSHKDPFEITKFVEYLFSVYGEKLMVKYGKVHDYLGCDYNISTPGAVKVSMIKYSRKTLGDFPEKITKAASLPASRLQ